MPTDITSDIATQAVEPSSSSADGQSASARPIADLITAQQMLDNRIALRKRRRGIGLTRFTAPGACDDMGGTLSGSGTNFGNV